MMTMTTPGPRSGKRSRKRLSDRFELILTLGTGLAALWVFAALVFSMM